MQVRETTIRELLAGERQFRVPIFQRRFSWTATELARLWSDVLRQYEEQTAAGRGSNHFLGSFVLMPELAAFTRPIPSAILVDGQQRLLSILVLLIAIRDREARSDPSATQRCGELYLVNRWQPPDTYLRVVPTPADEPAFAALVGGERELGHRLTDAYEFFAGQLEAGDAAGYGIDLERITRAVVERLSVVDITTGAQDNPYRIFESINATGRALTQADLLRNYIFMRLPVMGRHVYDTTWRPMEDLVGSEHLEGLARVDLQCRGFDASVDDVYRQQRERLEQIDSEEGVAAAVSRLTERAVHFNAILRPATSPVALADPLARLARWGARSADPLVITLLELHAAGTTTAESTALALAHIESYLVRRFLVGLPTSGLTRLFVRMSQQLGGISDAAAAVRVLLSEEPADWPTDRAVREAVLERPFYTIGRPAQRRYVLDRLEDSFGAREPVDIKRAQLSIEHVLPQTLSQAWRDHLSAAGDDPDDVHTRLVHTLGNLTLTAFNGTLSNLPMERKRQIYSASHLALNDSLQATETWSSRQIEERGAALGERIISIWGPPMRVPRAESAFASPNFWRPLEDLLARIPRGYWASYVDIAAVAGTTEGWVGRHIRNVPNLPGSHRAIGAADEPDVTSEWALRLRAEGIMGNDGSLKEERRMQAEALRALVDPG